MLTVLGKRLTGVSRNDNRLFSLKVRQLGARAHARHVQLDTRLPCFSAASLKNWEEPGDKASFVEGRNKASDIYPTMDDRFMSLDEWST